MSSGLTLRLVGGFLVLAALGCTEEREVPAPRRDPLEGLEPLTRSLVAVHEWAKKNPNKPAPATVADVLRMLAKEQGLDLTEYTDYRGHGTFSSLCRATEAKAVRSGNAPWVVVAIDLPGKSIPGVTAFKFILVDARGRLVDAVGCAINTRYGGLWGEMLDVPEPDGAQFIIRFTGMHGHNFHDITHGGVEYHFGQGRAEDEKGDWKNRGLCRVAIRDGWFSVVFPKLDPTDATRARPVRPRFDRK